MNYSLAVTLNYPTQVIQAEAKRDVTEHELIKVILAYLEDTEATSMTFVVVPHREPDNG
jgi:hypothetical protein